MQRATLAVVCVFLFTLASVMCAAAPTILTLDIARAVQDVGGAILFACSLALLADVFAPGKERAAALAAYGATIGGQVLSSLALATLVLGLLRGTSTAGRRASRWCRLRSPPYRVRRS